MRSWTGAGGTVSFGGSTPSANEMPMSDDTPVTPTTPRRTFLAQLATVTAAFAATACASGGASAAAALPGAAEPVGEFPKLAPVPALPALEFDDSWASRITGRYRAVFDSPAIEDGTAVFNAYSYMQGFKDMYKVQDADVNAVIVMRHMAIPMILDDEIWARYKLGEYTKTKEAAGDAWAQRNPFWKAAPGDTGGADYTLDALHRRGVVLLGCALATQGFAGILARRAGDSSAAMFDELRRHLVPGVQLQPSGIFAVMRAQEAGCHYMRST